MNVCQSIPRRDCGRCLPNVEQNPYHIAGGYRETDEKCKSCTLIRRKPRNRIIDDSGREMKKMYPLRKLLLLEPVLQSYEWVRKGKEYHLLTSWCRMAVCTD